MAPRKKKPLRRVVGYTRVSTTEQASKDLSLPAQAAELATSGARPLPMTGYKLELLTGLVRDVVERIAV